MNEDIDRITDEIDRLAMKTTDSAPMELAIERAKLLKRMQMWKLGGGAAAFLVSAVSYALFFTNQDYGVPEAGAVMVAVFVLIMIVARSDMNSKVENWLTRARRVVGK